MVLAASPRGGRGLKGGSERQVRLLSIPSIFLRAVNMSQTPSSSQASATSSNFLKRAQYEQARLTVLNLGKVVGSAAEKAAARDWVEEYEANLVRSSFFSFPASDFVLAKAPAPGAVFVARPLV